MFWPDVVEFPACMHKVQELLVKASDLIFHLLPHFTHVVCIVCSRKELNRSAKTKVDHLLELLLNLLLRFEFSLGYP